MEAKKAVTILVLLISVSISMTIFVYNYLTVVDVKEFGMYLTVESYAGFNVGTEAIFFGTIPPGGGGSRNITLRNGYNIPLRIDIQAFGDLSRWVYVSENGFILQPDENKSVKVTTLVPGDAKFGNYTGSLKIIFRKV